MARVTAGQTKEYSLPDQVKVNTPEKEKKFKQKKYREKVEAMGGKVKYAEEFKKEKFKSKSKDVADLSGKRKDKYKVLSKTRVVTPSGKEKPVRKIPIISRSETSSRQDDGTMKTTQFSAKAHNQENSTEPTKFKDIDSRFYGLKGGGRAYGKNS